MANSPACPHPGTLRKRVLCPPGLRLAQLRDLAGVGKPDHHGTRQPGLETVAARLPTTADGPGHRRGTAGLYGAGEGGDGGGVRGVANFFHAVAAPATMLPATTLLSISGSPFDVYRHTVYVYWVIKSYRNAKTRRVHDTGAPKGFKGLDGPRAVRVLNLLAAADRLRDLPRLASYRLRKLRGDRARQWSLTVNLPWVVCFTPDRAGGWRDVEITDYH